MAECHADVALLQTWRPQKHKLRAVSVVFAGPGLKVRMTKFGQPLICLTEHALNLRPGFSVDQVIGRVDKIEHLDCSLIGRNPALRVIFECGPASEEEPI